MKTLLNQSFIQTGAMVYSRLERFRKSERGDAMGWVMGTFFVLLLLIVVYGLFREQVNTFVVQKIFGKMNSMD